MDTWETEKQVCKLHTSVFLNIINLILYELSDVNKGKSEGISSSRGCVCQPWVCVCRLESHIQGNNAFCAMLWKKHGLSLPVAKLHWAMAWSEQASYSWPLLLLLTTQTSTLIAPGPHYTAIDDSPLWGLSGTSALLDSTIVYRDNDSVNVTIHSIFSTQSFELFVVYTSVHVQVFKGILKLKLCHCLITLMSFSFTFFQYNDEWGLGLWSCKKMQKSNIKTS